MSAPSWFLLWCESDTSYSLVRHSAVVCEESVQIGDDVKFFFNGKECEGNVRAFGEDPEELQKLQDEMNATNKARPPSFHENSPRRAAKKSREKMINIAKSWKSGKSGRVHNSMRPKDSKSKAISILNRSPAKGSPVHTMSASQALLAKRRTSMTVSGTRGRGIYTSSSSDDEISKEEREIYEKIKEKEACKKAKQDATLLKGLRELPNPIKMNAISGGTPNDTQVAAVANLPTDKTTGIQIMEAAEGPACIDDDSRNKTPPPEVPSPDEKSRGDTPKDLDQMAGCSKDNEKVDDSNDSDAEGVKVAPKKPHSVDKTFPFEGIQYLYDDPAVYIDDDQRKKLFVELRSSTKTPAVYCKKDDFDKARKYAKTAKAYARKIMMGVFTPEALRQCSLSGELYKAGGKDKMARKAKLDPKGVEAIIAAAYARQAKKNWTPVADEQSIKTSLRQKLVEYRAPRKSVPKQATP